MFYSIIRSDGQELVCDRCGRFLSVAVEFDLDGRQMRVGRECARHFGIVWTPKVGPCADDAEMFTQAVAIWQFKSQPPYRWPTRNWQAVRDALGSVAWKKAMMRVYNAR